MFSWLARQMRAMLRFLGGWFSRHALGVTITLLIVAFVFVFFWERMVISIYPGEVGVLWRRLSGTVIDKVYGEGLHLVLPINIMYHYNVRWQVLRRTVMGLTRDGLELTTDVGLLYRVRSDLAAELHQSVGEGYLEALIIPTLDAAIRNALGRLDVEKLYVLREEDVYRTDAGRVDLFERDLIEHAKEDVGRKYIEVDDVSVLRLVLPTRIQEAIQRKREEEQLALLYDFTLQRERKESERKRIEAQGVRDFQDTTGGPTDNYLTFKSIEALLELAKSSNAKIIVFGGKGGLPLLLGTGPFAPDAQLPSK